MMIASVSSDSYFKSKHVETLNEARSFIEDNVKHFEDNGFEVVQRKELYVVLRKPVVDDICTEITVQVCREINNAKGRRS